MSAFHQSIRHPGIHLKLAVLAIVLTAIVSAAIGTAPAVAAGLCPTGADACLIVNTNVDNNTRDATLSLREAMLLDTGGLSFGSLTPLESSKVLINTQQGTGPTGIRYIYFDPAIFCATCSTRTIVLSPPGFGGPSASIDGNVDLEAGLMTPPGFGGPSSLPPGFGGPSGGGNGNGNGWGGGNVPPGQEDSAPDGFDLIAKAADLMTPPGFGGPSGRIGLASGYQGELAASVVLDGSRLDATVAGMRVVRGTPWIRGLRFQNFAGTALEIDASVSGQTVIGSDYNQYNDAAEAVAFSNNGRDVVVVGQ